MKQLGKRMVSMLLCVLLTAGMLPSIALAEVTPLSEKVEIATPEALKEMRSGVYVLTADIILDESWVPLSDFSGTLDGNGYTITLTGHPVFEQIHEGGRVINLLLAGRVESDGVVGALANESAGEIANCYSSAHVSAPKIGFQNYAGGFVGKMTAGHITNCFSTGTYGMGKDSSNGGKIVGYNYNKTALNHCYWTASGHPNYGAGDGVQDSTCGKKLEVDAKSSEMIDLLNAQKGADGLSWGYDAESGYPVPGGGVETETADKDALLTAISAAEVKLADGNTYTKETLAALRAALDAAIATNSSTHASQVEVDAKTLALREAIDALKVDLTGKTDRDKLLAAISSAESVERDEMHTPSSWNAFVDAQGEAKAVHASPAATQAEIDAATVQLNTAQGGLQKWTAQVVPEPAPESEHLISVTTVEQLGNMGDPEAYYRLDKDLSVSASLGELKGTFDGNGHVITLGGKPLFKSVAESGTIQNLGVVGNVRLGVGASFVEGACAGRILNSYSKADIKGTNIAVGLAGVLDGGLISNVYFSGTLATESVEENTIAGLVNWYKAGAIHNGYWLESQSKFAVKDGAYSHTSNGALDISDLEDASFRERMNAFRGEGRAWKLDGDGLPYLGDEDKEYVPPAGTGTYQYPVYFQQFDARGNLTEMELLDSNGLSLTLGELYQGDAGRLSMPGYDGPIKWVTSNPDAINMYFVDSNENSRDRILYAKTTGTATITVTNGAEDPEKLVILAQFPVKVTKGQMVDVKYYVGAREVTNGQEVEIAGSLWNTVKVMARYGGTGYQEVGAQLITVSVGGSKIVTASGRSFAFREPGTADITVSALGKTIRIKVCSTYVPVTAIKPGPNQDTPEPNSPEAKYKDTQGNYILHERNPNSASLTDFNKLQDTPNVIVTPANASYAESWTLESSNPTVAQFVDSLVVRVVPYRAGEVKFTATSKDKGLETRVYGISTAKFIYLNPVTSVKGPREPITVAENKAQALDLTFTGSKSAEGYHVSEAGMTWNYTSADGGAVEIFRGAECSFVRNDKEYYVSNDKYQIRGVRAGTVTAVGTPVDQTGGAQPVVLTITVTDGVAEVPADISEQVKLGLSTGIHYLQTAQGEKTFAYNSEWELFALLRSGVSLDADTLEPYFQSVATTFKSPKNELLKPTTLARVILALTAAGQDAGDFRGIDFLKLLGDNDLMTTGSNEAMWALIAMDTKPYEPVGAWNRDRLIAELLRYQNPETGGFGLTDNVTTGVDITAMSLQALAKYKEQEQVKVAVDKALRYLQNAQKWDGGFDNNCEASVQVLVALCALGLDALDPANGFVKGVNRNLIMSIMSYRVETEPYGFRHIADTLPQVMTTDQAVYGLADYARYQDGRPGIYDMSDLDAKGILKSRLAHVSTLKETEYTPESWAEVAAAKAAAESILAKAAATDEELAAAGDALTAAVKALVKQSTSEPGEPPKPEEKNITVSFRLVGDALHDDAAAHGKYQTWIKSQNYTLPKGSTVYDVFALALADHGLAFDESQHNYIGAIQAPEALGGYWLREFGNGPFSGWKYLVNGEYPGVGLRSKPLKEGDAVVWRYVDDFTDDFDNNDKWQEAPDTAPVPAPAVKPEGKHENELRPEITVDKNGEAKVTLSAKDMANSAADIVIEPIIKGEATKVSVVLPREALSAIAEDIGLTVKTTIANLSLSAAALSELNKSIGESMSISTETMRDEAGKPDGAVRVELKMDGKTISNLATGVIISLPVLTPAPGTVLLEMSDQGAHIIQKSAVVGQSLTARLGGSATVVVKDNTKSFPDIPRTHWSAEPVAFVTARELFAGTMAGQFDPEGMATRAMLFTVLARMEGKNVAGDTWYDGALRWAVAEGLTDGSAPESAITREQLATLLYRYMGSPEVTRGDGETQISDGEQVSPWATSAVSWAIEEGLLSGRGGGTLDPSGLATRAEVATVLQRLMPVLLR